MHLQSTVKHRCCKQMSASFQPLWNIALCSACSRFTRAKYSTVQNNQNKCRFTSLSNM